MARIHRVATSRTEHTCSKTGHVIPAGEPYTWAKPGFRTRRPICRCKQHPFRPSELMTGAAAAPTAAVEAFEDATADIDATSPDALDELTTSLEELGSAVEDYVQEREAALDAWEYGNSQLEEYRDTAQQALDDFQGHTVDEWSGDAEARDWDADEPDADDEPDAWQEWDAARIAHEDAVADYESHVSEQIDAAVEMATGLEF